MSNPYSENYNLLNKKWRAITYDWDTMSSFSDTNSKLYCLTDFQAQWLQANVPYLSWLTRQENCPCTPEDLALLASELEYALMTCVDFQPYQLDFVYSQTNQATLDDYEDAYNLGGIPELNPDTPTDFYSGDGSQDRLDALCSACNIYIRTYTANWVTQAQIALGVVAIFGALASISIVGGVIASVLVGGLAFITQVALDAMTDEEALDNVVCCMYSSLVGQVIDEINFENSLNACGFMVGSNEQIIVDIISSDLDKFGNWLSFINAIGDQLELAEAGVKSCPCVNCLPYVPITFDNPLNYNVTQGTIDNVVGLPIPSLRTQDNGSFIQLIFNSICIHEVLLTGLNVDINPFGLTFAEYEILDQDDNSLTGGQIPMPPLSNMVWGNYNLPVNVPTLVTGFRLRIIRNTTSAVYLNVDNVNIY